MAVPSEYSPDARMGRAQKGTMKKLTSIILAASVAVFTMIAIAPPASAVSYGKVAGSGATWQKYSKAHDEVLNINTRQMAITNILAAGGNSYLAERAGSAAVRGSTACRSTAYFGTLDMINTAYRKGQWANTMAKALDYGLRKGGWAGKAYREAANATAAAAIKTGNSLYLAGQSRAILAQMSLQGCL